jgi:hypothetical protein
MLLIFFKNRHRASVGCHVCGKACYDLQQCRGTLTGANPSQD